MDLAGLLCLFGCTESLMTRWKRTGDVIVGSDETGTQLVRVPINEPVHLRTAFDPVQKLVRINCP